ncbi:MAG: cupin domain-containing protein [Chloroflexi bacterium]|nr:MAG: hypothetical protein CUN54_00830 [Phototrophicales bacterium]RMF82720.1 MAG: cupin domain-containing protein [Chloroflexota bacterium]
MNEPVVVDFDEMPWEAHPTIAGIHIKMTPHDRAYSPDDILIARVEGGGEIPWHVHEGQSEIVYVLQGTGVLYCAESQDLNAISKYSLKPGLAAVVPPDVWHRVENTDTIEMLLFASHVAG